jgi:DNA-binding NarL/FixJ family response regulator
MKSSLICDDHVMMREAIAGLVEVAWPDATIVRAPDFPSAWDAIKSNPDICICDLVMPGASPLEGIRGLRQRAPHTPILVVTGSEEDELLLALFEMGISGFVPKTARSAVIEAAITVILAGERYIPARVLDLVSTSGGQETQTSGSALATLSPRQIEVLKFIAEGQSNKEIARSLSLSPSTVKAHIAAAMAILGATNRTEAAMIARQNGSI